MHVQRFARLALAAALALSAVVCRNAPANALVWWTPSWGEARARSLAKTFEAAHPGVTVVVQVSVPDGLPTRIQTALRSGSPPEIPAAAQARDAGKIRFRPQRQIGSTQGRAIRPRT